MRATRDRDRKAEWISGRLCEECYTAEQTAARAKAREEHAEANAQAAEANQAAGLPALTGSPKQIAWAESIRAGILEQVPEVEARIAGAPNQGDRDLADRALAAVTGQAEASWWIDNRRERLGPLVRRTALGIATAAAQAQKASDFIMGRNGKI